MVVDNTGVATLWRCQIGSLTMTANSSASRVNGANPKGRRPLKQLGESQYLRSMHAVAPVSVSISVLNALQQTCFSCGDNAASCQWCRCTTRDLFKIFNKKTKIEAKVRHNVHVRCTRECANNGAGLVWDCCGTEGPRVGYRLCHAQSSCTWRLCCILLRQERILTKFFLIF